jgi:outer membrane lipoprotein-sorting protein
VAGIFFRMGPFVLAGLLTAFPVAGAPFGDVDQVLAEIAEARGAIHTFAADFVQKKEIDLFASVITSRGRLIMRPPDLLVWKVQEPLQAVFFMHRGSAGTWDPHTGEVKRWGMGGSRRLQPENEWLLRLFMGPIDELKKDFKIQIVEGEGALLLLRLVPGATDSRAVPSEIRLGFDPNELYLRRIVLREKSGDLTKIRFEKIVVNGNIDKDIPHWLQEVGPR